MGMFLLAEQTKEALTTGDVIIICITVFFVMMCFCGDD